MPTIKERFASWVEKQKREHAEAKAFKQELKAEEKAAYKQGLRKGKLRAARRRGYRKAMAASQPLSKKMEGFARGTTGAMNVLFGDGFAQPPRRTTTKQRRKGTTIRVNGTTIHVSRGGSKKKKRKYREQNPLEFLM